jgi:homoserine O-acetyltransferase
LRTHGGGGAGSRRQRPQYPIGTVAFYGPDDKTNTKTAAGVILHDGAELIMRRWVATDVTTNPKVQRELRDFFLRHGVKQVAVSQGNMGGPHEEGQDFPRGEDRPLSVLAGETGEQPEGLTGMAKQPRTVRGSIMRVAVLAALVWVATTRSGSAGTYPAPTPGDYVLKKFRFSSGETLPEVRLHYRTLGQARGDGTGKVRNAVLILHGTGGQGGNFVDKGLGAEGFAGQLFGKGQPLDAGRYYLIIPDNLGHGQSSKPSDGLRARFPRYGYHDMIEAQYRLVTEGLKVNHLRLVMGTSMGGMHTWLWGQKYPEFVDALVPLASLPTQISGRNRMWRKMVSELIRTDPSWHEGNYQAQPRGSRFAAEMLFLMSSNPVIRQQQGPTLKAADEVFAKGVAGMVARTDANDLLYAVESSWDYDPAPGLPKIRAPLLAINFADDLINPPELGILEREIRRVPQGRAMVIPRSADTVGHGTHTKAAVWKHNLEAFLKETER